MLNSLADAAATLLYAVLSAGLFGAGVVTEMRGFSAFGGGDTMLAAWLVGMGLVACVAGLFVFRDVVRPRIASAS
ncbi:hypothetical protein [Halobacterium zhouii]|uniref:hypothetical protein n=1 Tax=Halobacterium zhouii TaxID=2902624 RepID=UPI001E286B21|nr:hypothetical protein [Halobacterium zhouii]